MSNRVRKITTIAEIPMKCDCGWSGGEDKCGTLSSSEFTGGVIQARCPSCGGIAVQSEDCKYEFLRQKQ